MAREKKDAKPFSIRMDRTIFDRLNQFCEESGQSKTKAIERAINMYINDYDIKMQKLNKVD